MPCLYCERPVRYPSNGMCNVHYNRLLRHGHPTNGPLPAIMEAFEAAQARVDRDPCPWCGVRGDHGCKHRRIAA